MGDEDKATQVLTLLTDHVGKEDIWRDEIKESISNLHDCVTNFHGKYEPVLTKLICRAKFWNGVRDTVIKGTALSIAVSFVGTVGAALWFYAKHLLAKG